MKQIRYRIVSLILAFITIFSLFPVDIAYGALGYGDGMGDTSKLGTPGTGGWEPTSTGFRVYIVNDSGKLVSNIVDIISADISSKKRVVACFGSRGVPEWQGFAEGTFKRGDVYGGQKENSTIFVLPPSAISISSSNIGHVCKTPLSSKMPLQSVSYATVNGEKKRKWHTHGETLRKYMLGDSSADLWMGGEGGAGSDGDAEEFTYEGIREKTFGEALQKWENTLWEKVELYKQNENYSDKDILGLMGETVAEITNEVNSLDEDGLPKYDDVEKQTVLALLLKFQNELKDKIKNGSLRDDNGNKNEDDSNTNSILAFDIKELLDIAYAEDTNDTGVAPLYTNGGLIPLMEQVIGETPLFTFRPDVTLKGGGLQIDSNWGKESVLLTCAVNNFIIYMEPIFWASPQRLKSGGGPGATADYYFYGTVSNYAAWMPINWDNGGKRVGGNYETSLNTSFVWSMYTDTDLESPSIKAGTSFEVSPNKRVSDAQMNSPDYGIALHWYKFKANPNKLPRIPTYNYHDKDPNPEPHKPQHPGDPTVEPPGTIPLTPGEPKTPEEYKKTTRTINIVKVYDTELIDGTRIHDETHYQENCPGTIDILHEPEWKAIEYISSPFYYKDEHDLTEATEWNEVKDYVSGKVSFEYDITKEDGTVEKHISIAQPTQDVGEVPWDEVKDKPAKDKLGEVKLGVACDCAKEQGGEDADPRDGQHYWDTTLYVHLLRKEKVPETSTYDEPDHQPSGTPPAVPPHPSQDPHEPEDPNFDPETDHVEEDNIYCHYRIVKCYETITITDEGEQPPEPDGVFTTYKTNPVVKIQDEAQSADPFDGSWHLEDWDISDDYNPPLPDLWDPLTGTYSSKQGGHSPTEVNLIDKNDAKKEVTLYVHLVRRIKEGNPTGAIIIQQSQISKTIHTDDPNIGGYFGNYKFIVRPPSDFPDSHTAYYHHCCVGGDHRYHTCKCLGHTCYHKMPGRSGCNSPVFNFDLISAQDDLEIKKGVNVNTDPKVYGKSGAKHDAIGAGVTYNETISSLKCEADKFTYVSDGNQQRSAEYVTILWRGSPKYKDVPTLAKYKEKDIQLKFGSADNYNIPKDVLASGGTQPNKKSMHKRASQYWVGDLKFTFGLDEGKSHLHVASSCVTHNGYNCVNVVSQDYIAVEGTTFTYDFQAGVAIRFYAGKAKGLVAQPFGAQTNTPILEKKTGTHKELNVIQCKQIIHFYPYIRMTYMLNNLKDAEDEEKNTDANGYVNDVRKDTYVLSEHESTVLPADAVRVEWRNDYGDENLILTSQQWSVHQKAINGVDGNTQVWNGRNQVLPGGAIYQLSTPKDKPVEVILTTYQTVIDQKARNEYLSDPIPSGDEYTEAKVAKDHTDFINDAKEVFDNLKVVQWVNKNPGASTAWAKNFEEKDGDGALCLRGLQEKLRPDLGQDMKETANTEQKYYMRQQTTLSDYQNSKLSEWTRTIDQKQSIEEQTYEGDLDVFNMRHAITVYKLFTDASTGKVYMAQMEKKYSNNDTAMDNNEADIKSMVQSMKDLNADTYSMGQTFGATVTELCDKKIPGTAINNVLSGDAKDIDDATSFITNFVSALTRNKGTDYTAEWANGKQDGRWYNEAFDGAYLVRQRAQFNVGFAFTTNRVSALDPALCPPNKGQSDLYTKAFLSQFCVDSQSDATIAQGKVKNYLGTFKDTDITLPDMESLYVSKRFYIPNANVQDLN